METQSNETPETNEENNKRLRQETLAEHDKQVKIEIETWENEKETKLNVKNMDAITANTTTTVFVARLSYDTQEDDFRQLVQEYGKIKKVTLMIKDVKQQGDNNNNNNRKNNSNSKPTPHRGYGFVEYENEESVKVACKRAQGL